MKFWMSNKWSAALTFGLFVPSGLVAIGLRGLELTRSTASVGLALGGLSIDLVFVAGMWLAALAVLRLVPRFPRVIVAIAAVGLTLMNLSEVVSANFFLTTGSVLDFGILLYGVVGLVDNWDVISSETPFAIQALTGVGVVFPWVLPWFVARIAEEKFALEPLPQTAPRARYVWGFGVASLLLLAVATYVPKMSSRPAFTRASPQNLLASGLQYAITSLEDNLASGVGYVPVTKVELSPGDAPNIVIVLMESTRASATSILGGAEGTTPNLESLAKRGTVFDSAYTVVPHTSKALVAILCGIEPNLDMTIHESMRGIPTDCLPRILGQVGYESAFFQSATYVFENRIGLVSHMGFDSFFALENFDTATFARVNYFGVEDEVMLKPSETWLDSIPAQSPFVLTYLTVATHHNYLAPETRRKRKKFAPNDEFNRYLNSVRAVDSFVGDVVALLEKRGVMKNTILVVLGDHGEAFAEHGLRQHDNVMYQEGVHIPLLIVDGRDEKPKRVSHPVNQVDILPTVLEMAGVELEGGLFEGADMNALDEDRELFTQCWYRGSCFASITKDTKLIHYYDKRENEFYDLVNDPLETKNLIGTLEQSEVRGRIERGKRWRRNVTRRYQTYYTDIEKNPRMIEQTKLAQSRGGTFQNGLKILSSEFKPRVNPDGTLHLTIPIQARVARQMPQGTKIRVYGETPDGRRLTIQPAEIDGSRWRQTLTQAHYQMDVPTDVDSFNMLMEIEYQGKRLIAQDGNHEDETLVVVGSWKRDSAGKDSPN